MEGKYYCCGKPGHKSIMCRAKDKPKPEWAINKAKLENQSHLKRKRQQMTIKYQYTQIEIRK